MLPLYNDQISLLTVLAVIHRFSLKRPPLYNDRGNFVPQVVIIHSLTVCPNSDFYVVDSFDAVKLLLTTLIFLHACLMLLS